MDLVAAVDVGTGSARAGIFDSTGAMLGRAEVPIESHRPHPGHVEQDSGAIWEAVGRAMHAARDAAGAPPGDIVALSFDATCSLVVRDAAGAALPVSVEKTDRHWDTLLWLDHRAHAEARRCTATEHPLIARDGGAMSPEMQVPKLMWLKHHLPETWRRTGRMLDLADFLAWMATGTAARSACALGCKWSYRVEAPEPWPRDFLADVGLDDLFERAGLPDRAVPVADDLGPLTDAAAAHLGLTTGCRVAAGLIDAHAGALGSLAARLGDKADDAQYFSLIAGTSNCLMSIGPPTAPAQGLWGPYRDAILPGLWVREGGQSVSGGLLDHLCDVWTGAGPATPHLHTRIVQRIAELREREGWALAAGLDVLPDFAGNRSPIADPATRGVIAGLGLDAGFDGLCRLYWRTAVSLALGLRQILETMVSDPDTRPDLHLAGGHTRSPLLIDLYASATGCRVIVAEETDAVLLGTAIVAATGAGLHASLADAARAMGQPGTAHNPDPSAAAPLARDYAIFRAMQHHRCELSALRSA